MTAHTDLVDLHRHLDGSLRESTLRELAAKHDLALPEKLRFYRGMGLSDALARFEITLAVLQTPADVERIAAEICEDAEREGVSTLEIRFAPQLHRSAPMADIVDAAIAGIGGRAGVLLCGLYGEAPALIEELVQIGAQRSGVVGIDLAGGPAPHHTWSMHDYAPAFSLARDKGLGRTVHAGEGRAPQEIAVAINALHAQRIGHGTTLLNDPLVVELVLEKGITIEACPTSNIHTGVIETLDEHPLSQWLERGISACVCTDNTFFSDVDAPTEFQQVCDAQKLTATQRDTLLANGRVAAFAMR
jgi:adenosine deaminase